MSYLVLTAALIDKHNEHVAHGDRRPACPLCARFGFVKIDDERTGKAIAVNAPQTTDPKDW